VTRKSATLKTLNQQVAQASKAMKSLTTMVANQEAKRAQVEAEINAIHKSLSEDDLGTEKRDTLLQKEESLQKKLDEILVMLADKRGKLKEAERKLADLKRQVAASEDRQEELQKQIKDATSKVSEITLNKVGTEALWTVLRDYQELKKTLPSDRLSTIDSLLQDMSRQGVSIVTCAALLFMGMVDQATTFAENKGGGGGHSGSGWGRDKDEDDRQWIRRCLARSRQMMTPPGHKLKR
ncbi:MAG: hypothetical protein IKR69_07235, partial [Bacteroidales bacterium]|nr:hypothetical protein [Bacteroidales bacterium]